jgi:hypothetical protein
MWAFMGVANAAATNGRVLILDSMVSGGAASPEAQAATAAGKGVDVVDDATWSTMTTAQFAEYDALILGDPTCGFVSPAAEASALVWGAAVNGNVIIIGTDPVFHLFQGGGTLTNSGVAFAASDPGKTGAYITLSCQYHGTTPLTPVPLLDAFGTFTVTGVGCFNDAHIVATHPALAGLTDADLSNWSCSVHEAFDTIATGFLPLVIARGEHPGAIDFPDGSRGTPYILARGVRLITNIELAPDSATNSVGSSHTVTATVKENGVPVVGTTVTFTVVSGPHAGMTGTAVTDASGTAQFTYTGTAVGMDTIEASYVDSGGTTRTSNQVTKTWTLLAGLSIDDVSVPEGDAGTTNAVFTVSLVSASATPVTVDFATADGTAAAPGDYVSASGTLTFAPGETTKTISISVNGDLLVEPDESFFVDLSNPVGATIADGQGQGTIVNDDQPAAAHDHFKCYKAKNVGDRFDPRRVLLTDEFNTERVKVVRPEVFCAPVDKDGSGINDPTAHLTCYKINDVKGDEFPKFSKRDVEATDQFGTHTLVLKKIRSLCLPAAKSPSGQDPGAVPTELDHYKCYKAEEEDDEDEGTEFEPRRVLLTDQFTTERVTVVRPTAFCNPVDKDGSGINDPTAHLTCYKINDVRGDEFPRFVPRRINARDQFGVRGLRLEKTKRLCLPPPEPVGFPPGPGACVDTDNNANPDNDGDALCDNWETVGLDGDNDGVADLQLYDLNGDGTIDPSEQADLNHKDVYLEIDFMELHQPDAGALSDVIAAFAAAPVANPSGGPGVSLHIQTDEQALPHSDELAFTPCTASAPAGVPDFDAVKAASFGTAAERGAGASVTSAKRFAFHYSLFVHNLLGLDGTSGCAEIFGNDFIVSLGSWTTVGGHPVGTRDEQAGTLMHEFGHNLNLRHGGADDVNCKPNYLSVMSYTRQIDGAPISGRPLDYSRSALATLDETNLNEPVGIGGPAGDQTAYGPPPRQVVPANGPIDWNQDGDAVDTGVSVDVNNMGIGGCGGGGGLLQGHDDWSNLRYDFQNSGDFADGVHLSVIGQLEITFAEVQELRGIE